MSAQAIRFKFRTPKIDEERVSCMATMSSNAAIGQYLVFTLVYNFHVRKNRFN